MTDRAPPSRTAISNGTRRTSASSRGPGVHGREVAPRLRGGVADEVLERGVDAGRLQPAHVGRADGADEVGVLGDALLDPPPSRVADHVEHRREALVDPERAHRGADQRAHLLDELGVEGRTPGERGREGGGVPGDSPVRHSSWTRAGMPSRVPVTSRRCHPHSHRGPLDRVDRAGPVRPSRWPEPVLGDLLEPGGPAELALERRHGLAVTLVPVAHDLGELLLEGHPAEQVDHAVRRVRAVRFGDGKGVGRGHVRVLGEVG